MSAHEHAPHFKRAATVALKSVEVTHVAFCLGPEQPHFELASRAYKERLNDVRAMRGGSSPHRARSLCE